MRQRNSGYLDLAMLLDDVTVLAAVLFLPAPGLILGAEKSTSYLKATKTVVNTSNEEEVGSKVLRFPKDRSMGTISTRSRREDGNEPPKQYEGWLKPYRLKENCAWLEMSKSAYMSTR